MPPKPPETREDWDTLAQYRIRKVLRVRIAATIRQLESKICESGPAHIRPQPHILNRALTALAAEGVISKHKAPKQSGEREETVFYAYAAHDKASIEARINILLVPYRVHRMCVDRNDYCADVLEGIVRASFATSGDYHYLGLIPKDRPLDAAYVYTPLDVRLGVEVKNVREWVYPSSERIWPLLSKCVALDAVPILVAREIGYLAKQMFRAIGVLRLEFHRQVFSPLVANLLPMIQDKNGLGYKDVIALPSEPHQTVTNFVHNTIPQFIEPYRKRWNAHREVVAEYADTLGLASTKLSPRKRDELIAAFLKQIKVGE